MSNEHKLDQEQDIHDGEPKQDAIGTVDEIEPASDAVISGGSKWMRRLLPFLILILGLGGTITLVKSRKPPKREARVTHTMLVDTQTVAWKERNVRVRANGVIQPVREISIAPQVSGRVVRVHKNFVVGGFIKRNTPMIIIDSSDYRLAIHRAKANIANAQQALEVARSNQRVAKREWKRLGHSRGAKPTGLTFYEPQVKAAEAQLAGAQADLQLAKINVGRAVIRAPFNLRVRKKNVDLGQYVTTGMMLGTVYDTDVAEVIVSLPIDELRWVKVPRAGRSELPLVGPRVVVQLAGKRHYQREGVLVRSVGEIDPAGLMSKVVVAIADPYNLQRKDNSGYTPDFEINAPVDVELPGTALEKVIPIPAQALRVGSRVYTVDKDDKIAIKKVRVVRRTDDEAYIASGLRPGERVVLSALTGAVNGMKVRTRQRGKSEQPKTHKAQAKAPSKDAPAGAKR
ncbi:MAG: efflux RND transporter periplasmic adaptor subunit [Myxococcales bacterium]|nr:efflux RND transporter periplasmic adaptor subunit [Myxococcales bacterium]